MKEGMRMKKLAIMALSVVLISVMAIGGSLAYFTDTVTNANNVITAGSVQIEQIELQRDKSTAADDDLIAYACPHCGHEIEFRASDVDFDEDYLCPACNKPIFPEIEEDE